MKRYPSYSGKIVGQDSVLLRIGVLGFDPSQEVLCFAVSFFEALLLFPYGYEYQLNYHAQSDQFQGTIAES